MRSLLPTKPNLSINPSPPACNALLLPPSSQTPEATDLLQKFSVDSQTKTLEVPEPTKKKHGPLSSGDVANVPIASCDRSTPPLLPDYMDPNMCCLPNGHVSFYYGVDLCDDRAPELATARKQLPSFMADIYAFGVILMELLTKSVGDIISGQDCAPMKEGE
ncbi:YTH domain-containing protein [Cinnamomum micranthum f. kanehirae]|uniref:YTH domain-containing protein n=1 Tax=Cinnamomum micranthum f. kanehirae TaxID=337451 RepID=A0A443Q4L4_9MAGN|nr:YTH domain-containing protein [Cinnamomum micranthum f. kanehirae]